MVKQMYSYEVNIQSPVHMTMTGKFSAPTAAWQHMERDLTDYELIIMTQGCLYLELNEERFAVERGEYLFMPPYMRQRGFKPSDCSFYWLHFSPNHGMIRTDQPLHSLSSKKEATITLPQHGTLRDPERLIVMMKQLQDSVRSYNEQTLSNYMSTVILCSLYNQLLQQAPVADGSKQTQLYNDILDYIKWNWHENMKVSQIAQHFGYNEKYLSHLFTTMGGVSLKQYILQQKMEAAKFLLTDTNNNIGEIAAQLGYKDAHHFMKYFKKIVGLTPTDFRNAYAKRLLYYE